MCFFFIVSFCWPLWATVKQYEQQMVLLHKKKTGYLISEASSAGSVETKVLIIDYCKCKTAVLQIYSCSNMTNAFGPAYEHISSTAQAFQHRARLPIEGIELVDEWPIVGRQSSVSPTVDRQLTDARTDFVHRQSVNCRSTVHRQSTDSWPTVDRQSTYTSVDCRPTVDRLSTDVTYMIIDPK